MGEKESIQQEYFQSFIKRVVTIFWAIIAIPIQSGVEGILAGVDLVVRFPL